MTNEQLQLIRADFPILAEKIYNKDLIYFDNGATTQKPRCVVEKMEEGYYHLNANIHRGVHYLSQKATEAHEAARSTVAEFLHAGKREEIIFTRGTTEAINLVATSFGEAICKAGLPHIPPHGPPLVAGRGSSESLGPGGGTGGKQGER